MRGFPPSRQRRNVCAESCAKKVDRCEEAAMGMRSGRGRVAGVVLAIAVCGPPPSVQARDFFSNFFGVFGGRPPAPPVVSPFINDADPSDAPPRTRISHGGGPAWCVRTCDGRHFPASGTDDPSRQASCNSLCPAGKTEVVYG